MGLRTETLGSNTMSNDDAAPDDAEPKLTQHPTLDELLDPHVEVESQLGVDLVGDAAAEEAAVTVARHAERPAARQAGRGAESMTFESAAAKRFHWSWATRSCLFPAFVRR